MCGIAGAAWAGGAIPLDSAVLERMTTALAHRGPDDAGYYHSSLAPNLGSRDASGSTSSEGGRVQQNGPGAALGNRRLSIIDLAGGHQPISNEDNTIWITFNGEIYNYRELQS